MGWQPIETAPRDGTPVWVGAANGHAGSWAMEPACFYRGNWLNIYCDGQITWLPSHFMPLPTPPTTPDRAGEGK